MAIIGLTYLFQTLPPFTLKLLSLQIISTLFLSKSECSTPALLLHKGFSSISSSIDFLELLVAQNRKVSGPWGIIGSLLWLIAQLHVMFFFFFRLRLENKHVLKNLVLWRCSFSAINKDL